MVNVVKQRTAYPGEASLDFHAGAASGFDGHLQRIRVSHAHAVGVLRHVPRFEQRAVDLRAGTHHQHQPHAQAWS